MRSEPAGLIRLDDEVAQALGDGRPVVALETSIIAQGFPRPDNLALAREMTDAARAAGAVPALIALIDGRVRVGLDDDALVRIATEACAKVSARDLAAVLMSGGLGATTVASTMRIAAEVGITVFATGGIGGVHPGDGPPDVSADLMELSRRPVAVVCSGAKSILDLPATLELLEALGVPVIGHRTDRFPAFHAVDSGLAAPGRAEDVDEIAAVARVHWALGGGGVLVCEPPPADLAIPTSQLSGWLTAAHEAAASAGIAGPALTPFLLAELNRLSVGRTMAVNRALALANTRLGARLAGALVTADGPE